MKEWHQLRGDHVQDADDYAISVTKEDIPKAYAAQRRGVEPTLLQVWQVASVMVLRGVLSDVLVLQPFRERVIAK